MSGQPRPRGPGRANKPMRIHCLILGFRIDRETVCNASGNHPLCQKCLSRGGAPAERSARENCYLITPEEERPIQGSGLLAINAKVRKRCECGRIFFPKCNRQSLFSKCGELGERRRKAEWARKNPKNRLVSRRLGPIFRNEIKIF